MNIRKLLLEKKARLISLALVILMVVGGYYYWSSRDNGGNGTIIIKRGDFVQAVAVAGKVIPAQTVDLGFNRSGKIVSVPVKVGDRVGAGQILAELDSREALINLENAKIDLKKLRDNSVMTSADNNLTKDYEDALSNVDAGYLGIAEIFEDVNQILTDYRFSTYKSNLPNDTARNYFNTAVASYYKADNAYDLSLAEYQKLKRPLTKNQILTEAESSYKLLQTLAQALKDLDNYVSYMYDYSDVSSRSTDVVADRTNVKTWRSSVNALINDLDDSRNTLKNSAFNLQSQELTVSQRQHDYDDSFLRAPFSGIVTKMDFKIGQIVATGESQASLDSEGLFEIESFVPEINIAKIKIGNPAQVTLDAYGADVIFDAKILSIDPAETVRDGVSTYRIRLQFIKSDPRIKAGMTANLTLTTESKQNVISVPPSAVISNDEGKFVYLKTPDSIIKRPVVIGSVGALGQTEIVSGLNEGDIIVLDPKIDG